MKPNWWSRRPEPVGERPEEKAALMKLKRIASQYEEIRTSGKYARQLDPVDLRRIEALGVDIDVQGHNFE